MYPFFRLSKSLPPGLILTACLMLAGHAARAADDVQDQWQGVKRIVAIGDLHGDYDNYIAVLRAAGLINRRGNWTGGETHLVQMGDVPDRGPDTKRIIEHLQKLQRQASRKGGMVHALIGNHEFMNVTGDLRYVTPGEYAAMTTRNSSRMRDNYYRITVEALEARDAPPVIDDAFKQQWYEKFPLGYVEHRLAWQPGGEINKWLSTHNAVIRIDNLLFMHGGLGVEDTGMSLHDINSRIRAEITGSYDPETSFGDSQQGPLWYRGLALNPEEFEAPHVQALLDTYHVDHIVLGHTPSLGVITPRFGGKVIITDTGISSYYGGHIGSLLVENGKLYALEKGEQIPLPENEDGIIPYFQTMASLDPDNARLQAYLDQLLNPPTEEDLNVEVPVPEGFSEEAPAGSAD